VAGSTEAAVDQQVGGGGRLGQQDRILIPHRDDGAAERDALGALADGGEERQRRRQIVVEVPLISPAGVIAEPLGRLEQRDAVAQPTGRPAGPAVERDARVEAEPHSSQDDRRGRRPSNDDRRSVSIAARDQSAPGRLGTTRRPVPVTTLPQLVDLLL